MKKDIDFPKVEGVYVAVVREMNELNQHEWRVYLINNNDFMLNNILVTSKGYGKKDGEKQKTSIIRQHFDLVEANSYAVIEPIDPSVFHLFNEYWVSYYVDRKVFDKKFIFVPDTITEDNLVYIPQIEKEGILHQ